MDSSREINGKGPKFKMADVRISIYKNIFAKSYVPKLV